jgi:hypothetical protein
MQAIAAEHTVIFDAVAIHMRIGLPSKHAVAVSV